jgi:hypothetical protein
MGKSITVSPICAFMVCYRMNFTLLILIILVQDICNFIPETENVSRVYNVASML